MKASLIIPSYRRFGPLINTIEDLRRQKYESFEIIVVDQNKEWPEEYREDLVVIRKDQRIIWLSQEKPEVVLARNQAVKNSTGEILLFVDDDVEIPDQNFIQNHIKNYADSAVSVVIGRECTKGDEEKSSVQSDYFRSLSPLQQSLWFDRNSSYRTEICSFSTCNGSVRKKAFLEVKGFDESFKGNSYGDDSDLILRMHQNGIKSIYDPNAWLIHLRAPMGGLRMTDKKNIVNYSETAVGFWLFLFRHGTKDMYLHLLVHHVLRKTILLKSNLVRPWKQAIVVPGVIHALVKASILLKKGPQSEL